MNKNDEFFMKEAFMEAKKGLGHVAPNPLVGAIIVKAGKIIGRGYHENYGQEHAEVNAINSCDESVEGAIIFCNLEPCCHLNKQTPPCAQMLITKKIKKVIIANLDPSPNVSGNGVKLLREAGIEVVTDILKIEGEKLNEVFFYNMKTNMPFIHVKLAQTLDGKIATITGDSKWISSDQARKEVHQLRLKYDAVMIGRKTLEKDNAKLNIRMGIDSGGKTPYRIIISNINKLDLSLDIFNDGKTDKNIIVTTKEAFKLSSSEVINKHQKLFTRFLLIEEQGQDYFLEIFSKLKEMGINSVLVEGGARLITDLLKTNNVNKCSFYICPVLLGSGLSYFNEKDISSMKDAMKFENVQVRALENQAVMEIYPEIKLNNPEQLCSQV